MDTNWLAEIPAYAMEHPYLAAALGLLPSVNKAVGKLADLVLAKPMREKARRDMLSRAQTEQDIQAIKEGRAHFDGKNLVPAMPELTPLHDYQPSWQGLPPQQLPMAAALQEEGENLHTTLALAMEELARTPDDKVSDKAVDKDWFSRWRAEARLVTSDELRRMWARILVEEVKEPEAVSLKTLSVLKNLSKTDIEIFKKVARLHINHTVHFSTKLFMYNHKITENDIFLLQSRELLSEVVNISPMTRLKVGKVGFGFEAHGTMFIIKSKGYRVLASESLSFALSIPAKEILRVADDIPILTDTESKEMARFIFETLAGKETVMAVRLKKNKNLENEVICIYEAEQSLE